MTVYIIHCSGNNKYYVGATVKKDLPAYLRSKYCQARKSPDKKNLIYLAMREFPLDAFSIEPLTTCANKKMMDELERLWISLLAARNPDVGMNIARGGEGGWDGIRHSEFSIQKMKANPNRSRGFRTQKECDLHSKRMFGSGNPMWGRGDIAKRAWETRRKNRAVVK